MFLLAELKDTIRIPPETFHMKLIDAVKDEINRKLANKVTDLLLLLTFYLFFFCSSVQYLHYCTIFHLYIN